MDCISDLLVIKDLKYPLVLGIPWLKDVNPSINWIKGSVEIPSQEPFIGNPIIE